MQILEFFKALFMQYAWLCFLMAVAGANPLALRPPPGVNTVNLERNRKVVQRWLVGPKRVPWFYALQRKPNYGACKACLHFRASVNDLLSKGEFVLVTDKSRAPRTDFLTKHGAHKSHETCWQAFINQFGADGVLPNDRDPTGRIVIGPAPVMPVPRPIVPVTATRTIMRTIFRTVYTIVATYGSAAHLEQWLDCTSKNGTELGNVVNSHRSHVTFSGIVSSIATLLRREQIGRLLAACFFALLGDGSEQGHGQAEAEALAVQYSRRVPGLQPVLTCEYFDLQLVDRAESEDGTKHDAKAITACYKASLDSRFDEHTPGSAHLWLTMLIFMGLDGASTNMGAQNGIAARFAEFCCWIVARHCGAHNLELAVMHTSSIYPLLYSLEFGLKGLYARYGTAKQFGGLKDAAVMAEALDEKHSTHRFVSIHGIRWLASQSRTIDAALHNWTAAAIHLHAQAQCWQARSSILELSRWRLCGTTTTTGFAFIKILPSKPTGATLQRADLWAM